MPSCIARLHPICEVICQIMWATIQSLSHQQLQDDSSDEWDHINWEVILCFLFFFSETSWSIEVAPDRAPPYMASSCTLCLLQEYLHTQFCCTAAAAAAALCILWSQKCSVSHNPSRHVSFMKLYLVEAKSLSSSHVLEEEEDCKMAAISHMSEDHCKTSKDHGNREIEVDGVKKLCTNTEHRHNTITQT